ncbi:MAG: ABC transporter permease, partial [Actinomycetaceae bacterium]|nr:ABC transporter permease [Actinomycetaceae bacterium]
MNVKAQQQVDANVEGTHATVRASIKWKMPITYFLVALLNYYFWHEGSGIAKFSFMRSKADRIHIPIWEVPAKTVAMVAFIVVLLVFAWSIYRAIQRKPAGVIAAVLAAFVTVFAVFAWFGGGSSGTVTVTAVLASALALSTPLIFGSLSGVVSEHVGIVNIAIEGQLLIGAFAGVLVASIAKTVWA